MAEEKNKSSEINQGRYLVLLSQSDAASLKKFEKEFRVSVTSSEDLGRGTRSFDILSEKKSIHYRNLDVVVMEHADPEKLRHAVNDPGNPVVYFEKEREFYAADEFDLLRELKLQAEVFQDKLKELEEILQKKAAPPATITDMEWGLRTVGVDKTQLTGKGIEVCILDSGFFTGHPDFAGRTIEGKSFVAGESWDQDINGHGTHCTGIAAGNKRLDSGKRYGVAPESHILIGKVLSDSGKGSTSGILDAIDWALTKKARVISLSLASPAGVNEPPSLLFEKVGERALENNCLIIAAAGNDSNRPALPKPVSCPANSRSVLAVAAVDEQLKAARFSNAGINAATGGEINVSAPGVDILSSFSGNAPHPALYALKSGTSMATPFVSGLAALYMEANHGMTAIEIWKLLEKNARPLANAKFRDVGKGLVQIF